jgi:hypothetical protein
MLHSHSRWPATRSGRIRGALEQPAFKSLAQPSRLGYSQPDGGRRGLVQAIGLAAKEPAAVGPASVPAPPSAAAATPPPTGDIEEAIRALRCWAERPKESNPSIAQRDAAVAAATVVRDVVQYAVGPADLGSLHSASAVWSKSFPSHPCKQIVLTFASHLLSLSCLRFSAPVD